MGLLKKSASKAYLKDQAKNSSITCVDGEPQFAFNSSNEYDRESLLNRPSKLVHKLFHYHPIHQFVVILSACENSAADAPSC